MNFETLVARGGRDVRSASRPLIAPIYQTNVYVFEVMDTVESVWEHKRPGFVYGRYGTANHAMLEELVAALEGAEAAVACASGMGATTALLFGLFERGDHIVAARDLYGTTAAFFADEGRRLGIETDFVDATDAGQILAALRENTRAVFVEAISNPLLRLVDLPAVTGDLRRRGVELIVDASMASPAVFRPIEHGADIVVHSLTKFISGHGDVTGGLVLGRAEAMARVRDAMIRAGANLGPFDAWLATRGARTLAVRLERQCTSALALAAFLERHPAVLRAQERDGIAHHRHAFVQVCAERLGDMQVPRLADQADDLGAGVEHARAEAAPAHLEVGGGAGGAVVPHGGIAIVPEHQRPAFEPHQVAHGIPQRGLDPEGG